MIFEQKLTYSKEIVVFCECTYSHQKFGIFFKYNVLKIGVVNKGQHKICVHRKLTLDVRFMHFLTTWSLTKYNNFLVFVSLCWRPNNRYCHFPYWNPPKNLLLRGDLKIEVLENLEERNNTAKKKYLKGNFPFFKVR